MSEPPSERVYPPLYVSSGDTSVDRLAFFHVIERLKTQKRTGWVDHKVSNPESISDHMYRMAILAMCTSDTKLDVSRCVMMSLVHDLAEAQVGDITPREGISKPEKRRLEAEAMHNFVHEMLHGSPVALRIEALWKEYEEQTTDEAKFVKDLDRFEMAIQALEYEKADGTPRLQGFFDSSLPFVRHPEVKEWASAVTEERESTARKMTTFNDSTSSSTAL
ncbi:HD domain-containing protein [Hygrophoropsis aurantiaca]|uniref:HD domain-containing protein n=1 Tax=Hygrophoropsis aurantiaca TaxID=72124 RepID=A0ACB8A4N8_9AGAM|nr:HD domain-containing protein [Hygrophoropsis aurantiaca]